MTATPTAATYADGETIEYTSFHESGYSAGWVVRYAPAGEQTRLCPNCAQLAVPGEGRDDGFGRCPRCQAFCRFPALNPLVCIRTRSGSRTQVRESQLRKRTDGSDD